MHHKVVCFLIISLATAVLAVRTTCQNDIGTEDREEVNSSQQVQLTEPDASTKDTGTEDGEEVNSSQQVELTNPDASIKDELRRQLGTTSLKEYYKKHEDQKSCEKMYMKMKEDAEWGFEVMNEWVEFVAAITHGTPVCAPMKKVERACEKIAQDYDHGWQLTDLVRCSIVYTSPEALCAGAKKLKTVQLNGGYLNDLEKCEGNGGCSGVVIMKNRFASPYDGYADILTNILIQNRGIGWQVVELQLHLAPVIVAKEPAQAHAFSSDSVNLLAKLKQMWSQSHPGTTFHGGHDYYEVNRSSTDEGEKEAVKAAETSLYSSALVIAGCTNLADGNVKAQIANSPKCQCLPKINEETFNMNLQVLREMVK